MTFPNWIDQSFKVLAHEGGKVTYVYDIGGNIDKITGYDQTPNPQQTSTARSYPYLNHIGYDEFEQRTMLTSGNGITNNYVYEPQTRRLSTLKASSFGAQEHQQNKPPTPFHNLQYTYDKVGNVTHLVNNVSVQPWRNGSVFVGPQELTYTYDNLYQLKSMRGTYRPNVAYGYQYSDTYTYDEIGNIKTKAQSQDRLVWNNQTVNTSDTNPVVTQLTGSRFDHNVTALTYSLAYQYTGPRPHATNTVTETVPVNTNITRAYSYDTNGNNTGNTFQSATRVQTWDEEDRLKEVKINNVSIAKLRYSPDGERTKKQTAAGDAWYVNQYFVLLPNNLPTKHIFAGETRIASKTDAIYMQTAALTYYHPDHLGTTSYTSALNQDLLQHERYFAFGELWRPGSDQEETDLGRPDNLRREWTYTSKEWDVDTSLYYFGARYFDPHADAWQSPDPILASYMRGGGQAGGVYSPSSLGLYTYARNNPVVLKDPDGRESGQVSIPGSIERTFDLRNTPGNVKATVIGTIIAALPAPLGAALVAFGFLNVPTANAPRPGQKTTPSPTTTERAVEVGTAVIGGVVAKGPKAGATNGVTAEPTLGDLTSAETAQIQSAVDAAGRPIDVVGSAATGQRRGVGSELPIGKGPGTRSDIDYLAPPSAIPYFDGVQLPSVDPGSGIIPGTHNPFIGPSIRFEPQAPPRALPAKPSGT